MITRDDITLTAMEPAGWGGAQWAVLVRMPDGWGTFTTVELKLVSTQGMPGLPNSKAGTQGNGFHVYSNSANVWFGVLETYDADTAVDLLLDWLQGKALGLELRALAPIDQLRTAVEQYINSLDMSSSRNPAETWDDVLSLVTEINARMGRTTND